MTREVKMFTSRGDDTLLSYDPATANMEEVNAAIDKLEKEAGGRAFDLATGNAVERVTPETGDVLIVRPIAGG